MASSGTTAMASSSSTTASGGSTASSKADVQIVNFMFKPMAVTIKVGGTVTWKQVDAVGHSVESTSTPPAWTTSPVMKPGQTFSHTFTKAGTYNYICGVHNYMTGKIVVTG
jgi:amicyanin